MRITETQKERRVESQHRLQGSIFAAVLMVLLFWGLRSCQMWEAPYPPPPRAGMVMDFGKLVQGGQPDGSSQAQPTPPPKPVAPPEPTPEPEAVTDDNDLPPVEESPEPIEEPTPEPEPEDPVEEPTDPPQPQEEAETPPEKTETPTEEKPPKGEPAKENGDSGQQDIPQESNNFEGNESGEGGTSLQLAGWHWDHPPIVNDDSREIGTMEFEIIINKYGEVMSVEVKERYSISISLVNKYKAAIERMTFSPEGSGERPNYTTGTIRIELTRR